MNIEEHFHGMYAVIPYAIIADNNLSSTDKIVYGVVSNLCNNRGYCWATNKYIGDILNRSSDAISKSITRLANSEHILSVLEVTEQGTKRVIKVNTGGYAKTLTPLGENTYHNNKEKKEKEFAISPPLSTAKQSLGVATTGGKSITNSEVEFALDVKSRYEQIRVEYIKGARGQMWEAKDYAQIVQLRREKLSASQIETAIFNMFENEWHKDHGWKNITPRFIGRKEMLNKYL